MTAWRRTRTSPLVVGERPRGADERARVAEELVSFAAPNSGHADQYRVLRQSIERIARESGARVFGITSAGPGEGKTITTLNLSGSLAQSAGTNILVVDADFHRPSVARYLGLAQRAPGLAEVILDGQFDVAKAIRRIDALGISILTAGAPHPAPYELLASARVGTLLADMRRLYHYVLIDTPPVLSVADSRLLGSLVDGFIVVVAANKTPRHELVEALRILEPAKIFGVVFNGDERPRGPYYTYRAYAGSPAASAPRSDRTGH